MSLYQPIKLIEHVCGSNTPSHMNQMTFPSVLIDYREHLQPPAPHSSVVNKVPAPRMAAMGCLGRKPCRGPFYAHEACAWASADPVLGEPPLPMDRVAHA